jgi:hypothetical protein
VITGVFIERCHLCWRASHRRLPNLGWPDV